MQFSPEKVLQYFDKPWKITLVVVFVSSMLSAWMINLFFGEFIFGLLAGVFVSTIVAYPVSVLGISTYEKLQVQNERLKQLNDELETYNRILAHDIKNKVSVISLSSYMIVKAMDTDDKRYQHAMNIKTSSEELNKLIKNLPSPKTTYQQGIPQGKDKTEHKTYGTMKDGKA